MKNSTDVWFIAFLMSKGAVIASYDVIQRGKVRCFFEITDEDWQKYKLEFNNSELIKFKGLIENIKDLSF